MFCGGAGGATYDGACTTGAAYDTGAAIAVVATGAAYDTGAAIAVVATPARATGAAKPVVPNIAMIAKRRLEQEGW